MAKAIYIDPKEVERRCNVVLRQLNKQADDADSNEVFATQQNMINFLLSLEELSDALQEDGYEVD